MNTRASEADATMFGCAHSFSVHRIAVQQCTPMHSDARPMEANYVYFENSSSNPYLIRRIEELNKTANGNVEAKVVCFYRRRDISNSLIMLADKHAKEVEEESEIPKEVDLTDKQKHQLKHRELFLSRQYESLPATHISVTPVKIQISKHIVHFIGNLKEENRQSPNRAFYLLVELIFLPSFLLSLPVTFL
ncbi:Metastasis-associated protein MTA3 [Varanus komodoensis]|nr:Metastasis-associated protein MTA3 [Varanus komodoensis]